jgi:hypothetical protein
VRFHILPNSIKKKGGKMTLGIAKKEKRIKKHLALNIITLVSSLLAVVNTARAQEISEKEKQLAMIQYTVPYRFDKALKVGDWVKYRITGEGEKAQEIELKVTKKENGGLWIVEKQSEGTQQKGLEINLLVNLENTKLVKILAVSEGGEKFEAMPLDDKRVSQIIETGKEMAKAELTSIIGWEKGTEKEKVVVAESILECSYLEPKYSEKYLESIKNYGTPVIEVKKKSRLYFNEDIPRLLPTQIALGWIPFIETFKETKGGFVKSVQMNLELVGYSGHKE